MIRVRYSTAFQPAAPVIDVLLGHQGLPPPGYAIEAQLDTGADRTVIPTAAANALHLPHVGSRSAGVAGGGVIAYEIYEVAIRIDGVMDFILEVAAADEPHVLLGRDVLNALHTHLDGPGRMLTLSAHPLLAATP